MRFLLKPLTLRGEVLGSIFAVLLPSIAFMFCYYPSRQEQLALDAFRDRARENAELLAIGVGEALGHGDTLGVRAAVEAVSRDPALAYVVVLDSRGTPVLRWDPLHVQPTVAPLAVGEAHLDRTWLRAGAPVCFRDRSIGSVHLGLSAEVLEEIANDRLATGAMGLVVLALAAAASFYFAARIARPLAALGRAVIAVSDGNYAPELPSDGSEEMRALTGAFGSMAATVQESTTRLAAARDSALADATVKRSPAPPTPCADPAAASARWRWPGSAPRWKPPHTRPAGRLRRPCTSGWSSPSVTSDR